MSYKAESVSSNTIPTATIDILTCPICGQIARSGELTCSKCGMSLKSTGRTRKVEKPADLSDQNWKRSTEPIVNKTIVFEIDGAPLTLPMAKHLVVGRNVSGDAKKPDVDLGPFGGHEKGVSRFHLRISRDILIFIDDLASTNGTFLNGQRLFAHSDCPLSDGDDLWLGHLKIRVWLKNSNS